MNSDLPSDLDEHATFLIIHGHFVSVASDADQAIQALAEHENAEHMIERLRRLKATAERGAALAKSKLDSSRS